MILLGSHDFANHTYIYTEEAMEEGEVDEVPFTGKGNLNEAARAIVSILKQQLLSNLKKQLQCIYIQHSLKNIDIYM